jgi:hypothetical protein
VSARSGLPPWIVLVFAAVAVLLLPWAAALNVWLPDRHVARHWSITWTGFDLALAASLVSVAVAAYRASAWLGRLAMTAGTLLACDAWFDLLTAGHGTDLTIAIVAAVAAELPLAAICFALASRERRPAST